MFIKKRAKGNNRLTLLPQLGLALLDRAKGHITNGGSGNLVQACSAAKNGDDVQILCAGVVSAVHHGADGERERGAELGAGGDTTALLLLAGCCRGHLGEDAVQHLCKLIPLNGRLQRVPPRLTRVMPAAARRPRSSR